MRSEVEIIKGYLPEMADIMNKVPGETFELTCIETLLILTRKMKESDLLSELSIYTKVASNGRRIGDKDIANAAMSYIRIKTLSEAGQENFDPVTERELLKEFKSKKAKVENIIRLSRINAAAAEDYQKDAIEKTLSKNECLLKAFEIEISRLEKRIESAPKPLIRPKTEEKVEEEVAEEKPEESLPERRGFPELPFRKLFEKAVSYFEKGRQIRGEENGLKEVEAESSSSRCKEIPYYDKTLRFEKSLPCKDIPEFSLFFRKGNIFFGKTGNAAAFLYNNNDESLLELMNITPEFIQFMTEDLLSGEFQLEKFSESEKNSMRLYFNFLGIVFEKHLGRELSVQEYLRFKTNYNRLVRKKDELEAKDREDYYRALSLSDRYISFMQSYDMFFTDSKADIIRDIRSGNSMDLTSDLEMIIENHIVLPEAKEELSSLIEEIRYFNGKDVVEQSEESQEVIVPDFAGIKLYVRILTDAGEKKDEAVFSGENAFAAVSDYLLRDAPGKEIGLLRDSEEIALFRAKGHMISVPCIGREARQELPDIEKIEEIEDFISSELMRMEERGGYEE